MQYCPRCRRTFADGVRFCPSDGAQMSPSGADDRNLGRVLLNQFEMLDVCGRGAMGTVYRAHQRTMDRVVAVKVLRRELMQEPDVVRRFVREARAAARLQHPNIVTVHLVGETDDALPFLVMEYVDGISLESICDGGQPLGLGRACAIVKQIVSALSEAHQQGIIHRDLKPANILVFERGKQTDRVKVLDFGIAKIVEGTGESIITHNGMIFGTPHYLAPEQAQGNAVDARADLYSLGVILFRMTTGRLPFEGAAGMQVVLRHLRELPPSPRALNPLIPQPLEDLILGCLAKDRAMRPPSAEAVLSDLEWIAESLPPDDRAIDASATSRVKVVTAVQPIASLAPETRKLDKKPAAKPWTLPAWARPALMGGAAAVLAGGAIGIFWARSATPTDTMAPRPPIASAPVVNPAPPVAPLLDEHVLHEGDFIVRAGFERAPTAGQAAPLLVVLGGVEGEARVEVTVGALTMNARLDDGRYRASVPMAAGKQRVRVSALAPGRATPLVLAFDVEVAGVPSAVGTRPQARRARPVVSSDDDLPVTIVEPETHKTPPRALPPKNDSHAPVAPAAVTNTAAPVEPAPYPTTTTKVVIDKPKPLAPRTEAKPEPKPEPKPEARPAPPADEEAPPPPSGTRPRRPLDDPTTLPPPSPDETK